MVHVETDGCVCGVLKFGIEDDCTEMIQYTEAENGCMTPVIIQSIISNFGIEDTKDIIRNLYCQHCNSTLQYNSCGRLILRILSEQLNI